MNDNSHFAHAENVSIACLSDPEEEIRRKGVQYILEARRQFKADEDVRKFIPPEVNFASESFCNLVDLEMADKWEPPVTNDLSEEVILSALAQPLILDAYVSKQHSSSALQWSKL